MKKVVVGGIILVVVLIIVVVTGGSPSNTTETSSNGTAIYRPNTNSPASYERITTIPLQTYEEETVTLADFRASSTPIIVNSWATWCPFCVDELPDFAVFQQEVGSAVRIIAVDRQESIERAKQFSDEVGVTNILTMLVDNDDAFYRSIGGFSMPETLFITADGTIADHKRGPMTLEEVRARATQAFGL